MRARAARVVLLLGILLSGFVWTWFVTHTRTLRFEMESELRPSPFPTLEPQTSEDEQSAVLAGVATTPNRRRDVEGVRAPAASERFAEIERSMEELAPVERSDDSTSDADRAASNKAALLEIAEAVEQRKSLGSMSAQTLARFLRASSWSAARLSMLADLIDRERMQKQLAATYAKAAQEASDPAATSLWTQQERKRTVEAEKAKLLLDFIVSALRDGDSDLADALCSLDPAPPSLDVLKARVVDAMRREVETRLAARNAGSTGNPRLHPKPNSSR
jgi:hypothetical protein